MNLNDLVNYYVGLLIIQYQALARATATIGLLATEVLASLIINQVANAFNLQTAIGVQLDTIALYRGVSRNIYGPNLNKKYFVFPSYASPNIPGGGFSSYTDGGSNGYFWFIYADGQALVYTMTDQELMAMIEFKATADNLKPVSLEALDNLIAEYFGPGYSYLDLGNMQALFFEPLVDTSTLFPLAFTAGYIPRDAGVLYSLVRGQFGMFFSLPLYADPDHAGDLGFTDYPVGAGGGSLIRYP
jgi:hypothetical protein